MGPNPPILVPELRDYQQINAELVRRLNLGQRHIRLEGVEGQRLLVSQIAGTWQAVVEVDGNAGPELAAELNAPGLIVVCRGSAADGAGSQLIAGKVLLLQSCGTALGYFQNGGLIVACGKVGPRAGLNQKAGTLVLLDGSEGQAGERQSGGRLYLRSLVNGPHVGRGARGGRRIELAEADETASDVAAEDRALLAEAVQLVERFQSAS